MKIISNKEWQTLYQSYLKAQIWLESRITDPAGNRYLRPTTQQDTRTKQERGLYRTRHFLAYLGNPQRNYKTIHVTGTSGKGSVSAMTASLLQEFIPNVGLHTSPYMQVPNEKFVVNTKMIRPSLYTRYVLKLKEKLENYAQEGHETPQYGELGIILAHLFFSDEKVPWSVIEAGIGGRYDASNILQSKISVITNVDFDHVPQLGTELTSIAWHKAGIIKPDQVVVTGIVQPNLLDIVVSEAQQYGNSLYVLGRDFVVENILFNEGIIIADITTPFGFYPKIKIAHQGKFQAYNAAIAITAAQFAAIHEGKTLEKEQIQHALESTPINGKLEIMQHNPLVIIDGAHNPAKMKALGDFLKTQHTDKKITLIIGMLKTKDILHSLAEIVPWVDSIVATESKVIGKPAFPAQDMAKLIKKEYNVKQVSMNPNVQEAICIAIEQASQDTKHQRIVVVAGSIYMLGSARSFWQPSDELLFNLEYSQ